MMERGRSHRRRAASLFLALPLICSAQPGSAGGTPSEQHRYRGAGTAASPMMVCGEVVDYAGLVDGKMTVFSNVVLGDPRLRNDPRAVYDSSARPEHPTYVDMLIAGQGIGVRRFAFTKDARFTFRGEEAVADMVLGRCGPAFRPQWVRLDLDTLGRVKHAMAEAMVLRGELCAVSKHDLIVDGWLAEQSVEGATEGKEYGSVYRGRRRVRLPVTSHTWCTVNLDPVPLAALKARLGEYVEIVQDYHGNARYLDVYRTNDSFNFSGGNNALYYDYPPEGRPRLHRDAQGRWAFVLEPGVRHDDPPRKVLWTAPDVRVYDPQRFLVPFDFQEPGPYAGFARVWVDPESELVTHVFWWHDVE